MGDVVPFIAKVRSSGDWNAAERARLEELAQRLSAGGARVEAVFGATDDGDPWCVVTDENGDVLIHVARIGGKFVIHSAIDDSLTESTDLPSALREQVMAYGDDEEGGVVVPFSLAGRQAQSFLALVIASAFFYETAGSAGPLDAVESRPETLEHYDPPPPPPDIEAPTQERELAVQGAAMADRPEAAPSSQLTAAAEPDAPEPVRAAATPSQAAEAAPVEVAKAEAAPQATPELVLTAADGPVHVIRGTAGDDVLVGTAGDDRIEGGDGADTLSGGGGGRDVLLGGAGDDQIELGAQVTATGGDGADTFVIQAPAVMGDADTLLGVVTDFSLAQGDALVWNGHLIQLPQKPGEPSGSGGGGGDPTSPPTSGGGSDNEFGLTTLGPARKVELDLDGDGRIDGYVLLGGSSQAGDHQPIVVTGQGSAAETDPMGI